MTLKQMAWLTAGIWVMVLILCIMFFSMDFLDKKTALQFVGGGTTLSCIAWVIWLIRDE